MLGALCFGLPAYAQDDEMADEESALKAPKKPVVKTPSYPTMEVRGLCVDAVTKQPLAGIMIQALGHASYTAMTEEDGQFTIKVPTFATALYVHAPEYLSQHVGLGKGNEALSIEMLADKFLPMYDKMTHIGASTTAQMRNTTSQTIETDIENQLGADVRSITRSGAPAAPAMVLPCSCADSTPSRPMPSPSSSSTVWCRTCSRHAPRSITATTTTCC